jgi:hypothetical protein
VAIYMAKTANMRAAPIEPSAMPLRDPAPVKATGDVDFGPLVTVALDTATELNVVAAGTPVVTPAAWDACVVAGTRAADAVVAPETVVNWTCGTVTAVERIVVVEEPGMTDPEEMPVDSVHGTVRVVTIWTVVTGTEVWRYPPDEALTVDAQVTIAGFEETYAAQMPWK